MLCSYITKKPQPYVTIATAAIAFDNSSSAGTTVVVIVEFGRAGSDAASR